VIQRLVDSVAEVVAIGNGIDVQEEPFAPEAALQVIEDSAGDVCSVFTPVGQKDFRHPEVTANQLTRSKAYRY
jgi:hypothetical protein